MTVTQLHDSSLTVVEVTVIHKGLPMDTVLSLKFVQYSFYIRVFQVGSSSNILLNFSHIRQLLPYLNTLILSSGKQNEF